MNQQAATVVLIGLLSFWRSSWRYKPTPACPCKIRVSVLKLFFQTTAPLDPETMFEAGSVAFVLVVGRRQADLLQIAGALDPPRRLAGCLHSREHQA